MLSFFVSSLLPIQADLGIALPVSHTGHGQIHTYLGALALEVGAQVSNDILGSALGNTHNVLSSPRKGSALFLLDELIAGNLALRAGLGGRIALMNITANGANPLCHNNIPP
jgi:hypothetical protein